MGQDYDKGELYRKNKFEVELIDGPSVGAFDKISGLTMQMETVQYREGGVNGFVHQLPGQYVHPTIILEKGITNDETLFNWIGKIKGGQDSVEDARSNVEIRVLCGKQKEERWGFEVIDAYPIQWDGPDLRGEDDAEVARQTLELAHRGFTNLDGTPGRG